MAAPQEQPRLGQAMNQAVSHRQAMIETVIDMAKFQQLEVGKLNDLQGVIAFLVDENGRGPIRDKQILGTVTDVKAQRFTDLLGAERPGLQPYQAG